MTLSVAIVTFRVVVGRRVDVELINRSGIENVFTSERTNNEVLSAKVALRLKINSETPNH